MADRHIASAAEALWRYHCIYDALAPSDVIVGLGSYDLRVAERCADLFHSGLAPKILFTGRSGHWTRDRFDRTEASVFARRAAERGVPADAILLEERATNIGENITHAARIVGADASAILVTKPQTQRRCFATAKKQWPEAATLVTAPLHGFAEQILPDFDERHLICEMVGDLKRILDYPDAGFQIPQQVPQPVMDAYRYLVTQGYTAHL